MSIHLTARYICFNFGIVCSKSSIAFLALEDGSGIARLLAIYVSAATGTVVVFLLLFARYVIPKKDESSGGDITLTDSIDQKIKLGRLFSDIRRFASTRNVLATLLFIAGSTLVVPDVSKVNEPVISNSRRQ
jgi:hypothetical protein